MEYAVEVRNVTKRFQETAALKDVSVKFEKGKIHGIIGRNGSGKTVLFKCVCGLLETTEGEITVLGQKSGDGVHVPKGYARKFCVSEFRQTQEYHVYNVQDWGLFPLTTLSREGGTVCAPYAA